MSPAFRRGRCWRPCWLERRIRGTRRVGPWQAAEKREQLEQALEGRFQAHHRFLLTTQLAHLDDLDAYVAACDQEIAQALSREATPATAIGPAPAEREEPSLQSSSSAPQADVGAPEPAAGPPSTSRLAGLRGGGRKRIRPNQTQAHGPEGSILSDTELMHQRWSVGTS